MIYQTPYLESEEASGHSNLFKFFNIFSLIELLEVPPILHYISQLIMSALFLFHRDFRLFDNSALNLAIKSGKKILPVFIFNPDQIDPPKNPFFSHPSVQFMCESLKELDEEIRKNGSRLHMFYGEYVEVLSSLHKSFLFDSIYSNRDITQFARQRDSRIKSWCQDNAVRYVDCEDYDIVSSSKILRKDKTNFVVLTPYYEQLCIEFRRDKNVVPRPCSEPLKTGQLIVVDHPNLLRSIDNFYEPKPTLIQKGGRSQALISLSKITPEWQTVYGTNRNLPSLPEGTTRLSAHLKFGTISVRELFHKILDVSNGVIEKNSLIREVVFRSLFYRLWGSQSRLQWTESFRQEIDKQIPWKYPNEAPELWQAWKAGKTGFPLADAGMRQLEVEGFVHNRPRMVLAAVASKYFLFDWRDCAKYFATKLTDYDPILNASGWNYAAGLGENAQNCWRSPMNPFSQNLNYDPDCEYVKKWIPELRNVPNKDILQWSKSTKKRYADVDYPAPLVDQAGVSNRVTKMWRDAIETAA